MPSVGAQQKPIVKLMKVDQVKVSKVLKKSRIIVNGKLENLKDSLR